MRAGADPTAEEEGRIGIFPSWRWVFGTVLVYGVVLIVVLALLSRLLDFGAGS